jgi:zinc transport system ATP-binding protein
MKTHVLEVKNLCFSYPESLQGEILKGINFFLSPGESLGILGPNGGGKSTLLKIIVGLLRPTSGQVIFHAKNIHGPKLGYVPQAETLNAILPIPIKDFVNFGIIKSQSRYSLEKVLAMVGLEGKQDKLFNELSGGEKKRAQLAKALIAKPILLVLDEPTAGLDSTGQDQLLELISKLKKELNSAIIIVDHNINQIINRCDKILCLNRTSHWHDQKDFLTKNILESIYHCEFEHLLLHGKEILDYGPKSHKHRFCHEKST